MTVRTGERATRGSACREQGGPSIHADGQRAWRPDGAGLQRSLTAYRPGTHDRDERLGVGSRPVETSRVKLFSRVKPPSGPTPNNPGALFWVDIAIFGDTNWCTSAADRIDALSAGRSPADRPADSHSIPAPSVRVVVLVTPCLRLPWPALAESEQSAASAAFEMIEAAPGPMPRPCEDVSATVGVADSRTVGDPETNETAARRETADRAFVDRRRSILEGSIDPTRLNAETQRTLERYWAEVTLYAKPAACREIARHLNETFRRARAADPHHAERVMPIPTVGIGATADPCVKVTWPAFGPSAEEASVGARMVIDELLGPLPEDQVKIFVKAGPAAQAPAATPEGNSRTVPPTRPAAQTPLSRIGRNASCPCGSGVKFKRC